MCKLIQSSDLAGIDLILDRSAEGFIVTEGLGSTDTVVEDPPIDDSLNIVGYLVVVLVHSHRVQGVAALGIGDERRRHHLESRVVQAEFTARLIHVAVVRG